MAKSAPQGLETWKHGGTSATPQEKIEERIEITVFPHAARRRAALAHTPPARSLAHGETRDAPRSGTRRRCVAVGQGVARWRPRGGEAALTPRPGAHAPEVVARPRRTRRTRRRRRTRGRRGSPGAAAALLAPRAPRGRREAPSAEKIEERIEITVFPHAARRRAALAHTPPARSLAHGETRDAPRSGTRRRCVAVGQGVARWRPRGGEAALTPRPGAHAPEVVARPRRTRRTRRRRRTRGRRGSPGAAAALLAPRAPRGRREAPSARRSSRKRAQTAPGLPTQDPCPFFFAFITTLDAAVPSVQKNAGTEQ